MDEKILHLFHAQILWKLKNIKISLGDQEDSPASPGPIVVTDTESSSSSDSSDDIDSISSADSSQHLNAIFRTNGSDLNLDSDDSSFIDWQL